MLIIHPHNCIAMCLLRVELHPKRVSAWTYESVDGKRTKHYMVQLQDTKCHSGHQMPTSSSASWKSEPCKES